MQIPDSKEDGTNPGLGLDKQLHLSFWSELSAYAKLSVDTRGRRSNKMHTGQFFGLCETLKQN